MKATKPTKSIVKPNSPKVDIETYYKRRGLSYEHVRKINRNYVRYEGPSSEVKKGRVYLDTFVPPPGYSADELPNVESQPSPRPQQPNVSPAILTAERNKSKVRQPLQKASAQEFEELLTRLTRKKTISESDKKEKENSNPSPEPLKEVQITSITEECLNTTFPDMDEDLNESALMRLTQAAEIEFAKESGTTQMETEGNTQPRQGPLCASTPKLVNLTPTEYSDVTPRRSARLSSSKGSRSRCTSCSCCSDESSYKKPSKRNSAGSNLARKFLFPKPAERPPTPNIVVGDMVEDGNDDLFSQISLPDLEGGGASPKSRSIRNADASDHPTFGDSVLQTSSFLNEVDRLEEIAFGVDCKQMLTLNQDLQLQTMQTQICYPSDIFNLTTQHFNSTSANY